ncbi:MAG: ribosomal protein S18-alanine N-acetyltransferase [Pseudomonadota bacterium]|nr:ribosomal protein S18-alanine N-acetyltransferase [Pseudomonadota bacterium]
MDTSRPTGTQFFARTMRHSDLDLVVKNEAAANAHPWTKRIFIDCLRAGYQAWVLANRQEIAAHAVMSVAVEECHLLTLCVHPAFQRMGYGRKLFALLLDRAASLEAKECFLEVRVSNDRAISLYRSLGFTQIGERSSYYPADSGREDALILSCSLPLP